MSPTHVINIHMEQQLDVPSSRPMQEQLPTNKKRIHPTANHRGKQRRLDTSNYYNNNNSNSTQMTTDNQSTAYSVWTKESGLTMKTLDDMQWFDKIVYYNREFALFVDEQMEEMDELLALKSPCFSSWIGGLSICQDSSSASEDQGGGGWCLSASSSDEPSGPNSKRNQRPNRHSKDSNNDNYSGNLHSFSFYPSTAKDNPNAQAEQEYLESLEKLAGSPSTTFGSGNSEPISMRLVDPVSTTTTVTPLLSTATTTAQNNDPVAATFPNDPPQPTFASPEQFVRNRSPAVGLLTLWRTLPAHKKRSWRPQHPPPPLPPARASEPLPVHSPPPQRSHRRHGSKTLYL